jgi:hypothetical protein
VKRERLLEVTHRAWERIGDPLLAAGCGLLSLALYLQTMAPSVVTLFDDSLEFPLVVYRLGIAHPTGYPLYTLLGKLFTLGPWQNVAWAMNLLSAVSAASAVALVYGAAREMTRRRLPALLGAIALAVSPVFWSQAVIAEVYTLNSAFVAALLWLALRWARRPLRPVEPFSLLLVAPRRQRALFLPGEGTWTRLPPPVRKAARRIQTMYRRVFPLVPPKSRLQLGPLAYVLAALFGLSLTHHATVALLAPALFLFALLVEWRVFRRAALVGPEHPERPRWLQVAGKPVVLLAACFLVPLLLYLYLPLRGQVGSLDGSYAHTWTGFWRWVTARDYGAFFADNPLARQLEAGAYGELFWREFGPLGLALMLVGVVGLRRQPRALALTGLAFSTYVAFAVVYRVPDVQVFFLPAFLLTALWIGAGLDYAADLLRPRGPSLALRRLLACGLLLLYLSAIAQPLVIANHHYPDLDLSREWSGHDYALYVLGQPLPPDSTVVGLLGEMSLLRYFQETTGRRKDIETLAVDQEPIRRQAVDDALARGRTVYITRPLAGLAEDYALDAVVGLIDVKGEPQTLIRVGEPDYEVPNVPRATDLTPVPGLRLLGYGLLEHHAHWQSWARLRLWWQAAEGVAASEPSKISARLLNSKGHTVASTDAEPVAWAYPTTAWRPGEVIADAYEIPLPAGLPPGDYCPLVIVYEPTTGAERGRVELEPVYLGIDAGGSRIRPPRRALEASVAQTAYTRFGDVELLGYTPPDPESVYHSGDALPLTLLWQARGQPTGELGVAFWLAGDVEVPLGEQAMGGHFPTGQWQERQVIRQDPTLYLPEGAPAGTYRLKMRVTRNGRPVPWSRGLIPLGSDLDLGPVEIER